MARYIDVEKLLKELTTSPDGTKIPDFDCCNFPVKIDLRLLRRIILRQPTADVEEVKHGKLIYSSTDDKLHCSECFAVAPRNNGDIVYSEIYCCYKCGAKMDGGKQE